jgi:hypothetical protein
MNEIPISKTICSLNPRYSKYRNNDKLPKYVKHFLKLGWECQFN